MFTLIKRAGLCAALAASALLASTPAMARDHHRGHGGGDDAAIAIGAGMVGLALGAAIASDGRRDRYYDGGYYYDGPRYRAYPRQYYYYYDGGRRYRDHHRHYRDRDYYRHSHRGDRRWRRGW